MTEYNHSSNSNIDKKEDKKNNEVESATSSWLASLVYPLGRHLVIPFYFRNITVTGQENIPRNNPVILAPTHCSRWDALLVPYTTGRYVTGRDLHYMVSIDEIKGIQGWFVKHLGGFPVNPRQPSLGTFRHSIKLLCAGEMLVIFPEGDIFRERYVKPLKSGLARIALQAQAQIEEDIKIVPISIRYSQLYPSWGCDVTIGISEPIGVKDYYKNGGKKSGVKLTEDLETALKGIHEDVTEDDSVSIVTV